MAIHENREFKNERIELDGNEFHDCRFEGCTVVFTGEGEFPVLMSPRFVSCTFAIEGAAGNTVEYLRLLIGAGAANIVAEWLPELFEEPENATTH